MKILIDLNNDTDTELIKIRNMINTELEIRKNADPFSSFKHIDDEEPQEPEVIEEEIPVPVQETGLDTRGHITKPKKNTKTYLKKFEEGREKVWRMIKAEGWEGLPPGEIFEKIKTQWKKPYHKVAKYRGEGPITVNYISKLKKSFFPPIPLSKKKTPPVVKEIEEEGPTPDLPQEVLEEIENLNFIGYEDLFQKMCIKDFVRLTMKFGGTLDFRKASAVYKWMVYPEVDKSSGDIKKTGEERWMNFLNANDAFFKKHNIKIPLIPI